LEEFIISEQLHIANEESSSYMFQTERGASNIDLTIMNNQAIDYVIDWKIHDQESCSNHKIIKYGIGKGNDLFQKTGSNKTGTRYSDTEGHGKIPKDLHTNNGATTTWAKYCGCRSRGARQSPRSESMISTKHREIVELQEALDKACKSSFRPTRTTMTTKKGTQHTSVPWWTQRLTILRKKVNTQRRRYQHTKGDTVLREQRKEQYLTTKAEYAASVRKERLTSWKEYCTMTLATNPWNEIYKVAVGRRKIAPTTTLRQKDGKLTTNLHETLQYMIQKLTPEDNQDDHDAIHKQIRAITQETINTANDKEFSVQEVKNAVANMGGKKV